MSSTQIFVDPVQLFYNEEWVPADPTRNTPTPTPTLPWLAFVSSEDCRKELESKLLAKVISIPFPTDISDPNYEHVFKKLPAVAGILDMTSLGVWRKLQEEEGMSKGCLDAASFELNIAKSLLSLIQNVWKCQLSVATKKIIVVTEMTSALGNETSPVGSSLWGMVRTLRREFAKMNLDLILLDVPSGKAQVECILAECLNDSNEDKVAYDGAKRRFVKRLKPLFLEDKPIIFPSCETHIITGAFGALGLSLIEWMIQNGAKHFVLVGRSKPKDETVLALNHLMTKHVARLLTSTEFELTTVEGARTLVKEICTAGFPEVKGIFHLAGTKDDGIFLYQTAKKFDGVFQSKVFVAWNLHIISKEMNLKWFVLFSSIASLVGLEGVSNYSAANAFLDGLASYRKSLGIPAMSISWGAWKGMGLGKALVPKQIAGSQAVEPSDGWKALASLLHHSASEVAVIPFDWDEYAKLYGRAEPWLSDIFRTE